MVQRSAGLELIALSSSDVSWRPPAIIDKLLFGLRFIDSTRIVTSPSSWPGEEFASSQQRMNFWFRCYSACITQQLIQLVRLSYLHLESNRRCHSHTIVLTPFAIRRPACLEHVIRQTQCYMTCDHYIQLDLR